MSHVPITAVHRFVGDDFTLLVTVEGLAEAQVLGATFAVGAVTKTLGGGITVTEVDGVAVLNIALTAAETTALGAGVHDWQATAGPTPPSVVARGTLRLDARV